MSDHDNPILFNYVHHTFARACEQDRIAQSADEQYCCFNTGLSDAHSGAAVLGVQAECHT